MDMRVVDAEAAWLVESDVGQFMDVCTFPRSDFVCVL